MKKVLFLMLFLLVFGAAGISAQVRIGGDGVPNEAAVLDLNTDDTDTGTKGLALPRVSLATNDDDLGYSDLLEGMLVYNTNASMTDGVGVYYWDGNEWVKSAGGSDYIGSASIELSGNSFQRAALTGDVTADANSNTTTIAPGSVSRTKTSLLVGHLSCSASTWYTGETVIINPPAGCGPYNTQFTWLYPNQWLVGWTNEAEVMCYRHTTGSSGTYVYYWCWP